MKVLFVTGNFLPGKNGGIENYVFWLCGLLQQRNMHVEVAALYVSEEQDYRYEGIPVHYINGSLKQFEKLIKTHRFDICHFHEYSEYGGIEIPWFKKAKEYVQKVFFTFHLPYLTCYKNDFRYRGREDCSVFNNPDRCSRCILTEKLSGVVGMKPAVIGAACLNITPVVGSALRRKIRRKHQYLEELISISDQVFVIANWFQNILKDNGYTLPKIHIIPNKPPIDIAPLHLADHTILKRKLLFIGRIEPQKGLHLLCEAMKGCEVSKLELHVYGNATDKSYFQLCRSKYNFLYKGTVPRSQLLTTLKNFDFLVLPSVFTEMNPLVIIDAFHHHLPVIASAAKGNQDVLQEGKNGFLFNYNQAEDLKRVIQEAYLLKESGWQPAFSSSIHSDKDLEEIVSYYMREEEGEVSNIHHVKEL